MVLQVRYLVPALLAQNHNLPGIKENLIIHQKQMQKMFKE